MSHPQQQAFVRRVREQFTEPYFQSVPRVLDVGSLDINGSNREEFASSAHYIGVDVVPGKGVDLVAAAHTLAFRDGFFDTIISTECFEHDQHWRATLANIVRMLAPGGLFVFTCATTGRPEHGTLRSKPWDAPGLPWPTYYRNLEEVHIRSAIEVDAIFASYEFEIGHETHDLYFWGIKRS